MALDAETHHVFLITAQFAPPAPGDPPRRRAILPGTVVLLEFAPRRDYFFAAFGAGMNFSASESMQ